MIENGRCSELINGKTRAGLLGAAALYLLYISYQLFQSREDTNTTMTPAIRILFIVFFAAAAVALLCYAVYIWRQSVREDEQKPPEDDPKSLK